MACRLAGLALLAGLWGLVFGVLGAPAAAPRAPAAPAVGPEDAEAADASEPPKEKTEEEKKKEKEEEEHFIRGADLETDFEIDRLLRRALEFLEPPQTDHRKAVLVLQHIIDAATTTLTTEDHRVYRPARQRAEETIAALGPAGLSAYRTEVEGQALAALGPAGLATRDEEALRSVETRFFMSSLGDDAAYLLGCLCLDQHQFQRARRLLLRAIKEHPDPSVPRAEVLVRLAVACARSGDPQGARRAWADLERGGTGGLSAAAVEAVRAALATGDTSGVPDPAVAPTDGDLSVAARSSPTAGGVFADLPPDKIEVPRGLWLPGWQHTFDLVPPDIPVNYFGISSTSKPADAADAMREQLLASWERTGWFPAGSVLISEGLIYFKSPGALVCVEAATGRLRWEAKDPDREDPKNVGFSFHFARLGMGQPSSPAEILHFGDRVGRAFRLIGDRIYHIENHYLGDPRHRHLGVIMMVGGRPQRGKAPPERPSGNRLAAYEARTGRLLWRLGRTLDKAEPLRAVRFLAPPVGCGQHLLVPFEENDELFLAALGHEDGRLLWRTFLCTYPAGQVSPAQGVGLAVQGSDIFVATGYGVVLALDGIDGTVRWASRYERSVDERTMAMTGVSGVQGWSENSLAVRGERLLVLPSDAETTLEFDGRTGSLLARRPTPDVQYCLGLEGDSLFAASSEGVRRIALDSGRTLWQVALDDQERSLGQGFLTADAVYIPAGRAILRVDRASGARQTVLRVPEEGDDPLGNLFSDGTAFFVLGLGRLYGLEPGAARLADLERQAASLAERLTGLTQAMGQLDRQIGAARQRRRAVEPSLAAARRRAADLKKQAEDLDGRAAQAQAAIQDARKRLEEVDRQLAGLPPNAADLRSVRETLAKTIADEEQREKDLATQLEALKPERTEAETQLAAVENERADLDKQAADAGRRAIAHEKAVAETRAKRAAAFLARGRIQREYERLDQAAAEFRLAMEAAGGAEVGEDARRELLDVLLGLARAAPARSTGSAEAPRSALLAQAGQVAREPGEKARVLLGRAEMHEQRSEPERAAEVFLELGTVGSGALVAIEEGRDTWSVSGAALRDAGLRRLVASAPARVGALLADKGREALQAARSRKDAAALWDAARTYVGTPAGLEAGLEAARREAAAGAFEKAELVLEELGRSDDESAAAAALAALAQLHADRGWAYQAAEEWARLAETYPKTPLAAGDGLQAAGDVARERLSAVAKTGVESPAKKEGGFPDPPWKSLWQTRGQGVSLVRMPGVIVPADSQFIQEHLFLWAYGQRPRLICRTIATGEVVYEQDVGQSARFLSPPGRGPSTHVVLLGNQETFGGFGLVSGRFLWSRRKPPAPAGRRSATYSSMMGGVFVQGMFIHPPALAATQAEAYGGVLVVSPDAGTVWVLDAATGEPIWERTVRRRAFTMARAVGAYVALVLDGGTDLWVCDARTGRRLSQNRFAPPSYRMGRSIIPAGQGLLCQFYDPARGAQSVEYRELPSGRVVWNTEGPRATRGMWVVDGATVAFLNPDGSLELKAIATGVVRCRIPADQVDVPQPIDLALDARRGHLYVSGQGRGGGQQLRIFDMASGEAAGAFDFGGAYRRRMPAALYAQCGDLLPWIEMEPPARDAKGVLRSSGICTVRFYRRSDGKIVDGLTLPSSRNDGKFTLLNQIVVQNGAAILLMNEGMEIIGHAAGPNR